MRDPFSKPTVESCSGISVVPLSGFYTVLPTHLHYLLPQMHLRLSGPILRPHFTEDFPNSIFLSSNFIEHRPPSSCFPARTSGLPPFGTGRKAVYCSFATHRLQQLCFLQWCLIVGFIDRLMLCPQEPVLNQLESINHTVINFNCGIFPTPSK